MLTIDRRSTGGGTTKRTVRMPYVSALDGLRAVAVLAVLFYHDDLSWLRGGFLGVEVFFVISGYLITSILLGEYKTTGGLNLKRFWLGRARRLLPALYVMLLVVAAWWLLFFPNSVGKLKGQFLAGSLYFTNWFLVFTKVSYFDHLSRPSPLTHLWSLAVEEQFYLVWPLALWALLKLFKGRLLPLLFTTFTAALAAGLLMGLLFRVGHDPSVIYYGTETRASGVLMGAALAVVWRPWLSRRRPNRRRGNLADAGGLGALVVLMMFFLFATEFGAFLYRGGFLLVDLTTGLLIAACVTKSNRLLHTSLGSKPLVWVGQRSYGIYLWHWPIFAILQPGTLTGLLLFAVRIAVTGVVAAASYRYVEMPFRTGAVRKWIAEWRSAQGERRHFLAVRVAAGGCVLALVAGVVAVSVAVHGNAKSQLEVQLEQAAKDPANRADVASIGVRSVRPIAPDTATTATTTTSAPTTHPTTVPHAASTVAPSTPPATLAAPATPLAIGDSVMLGAANALRAAIPGIRVDAQVGRQWNAGVALVQSLRTAGQLGTTVIIGLGNNGTVTPAGFNAMMTALSGVAHVVVIDVRVDRSWQNSDNAILRAGVAAYPKARFVDWYGFSNGHSDWFFDDGTHLRPNTASNYAALVATALKPAGS